MFELHVKSDHILVKLSKHEVCVERRLILLTLSFSTGSEYLRPRHIFCESIRFELKDQHVAAEVTSPTNHLRRETRFDAKGFWRIAVE